MLYAGSSKLLLPARALTTAYRKCRLKRKSCKYSNSSKRGRQSLSTTRRPRVAQFSPYISSQMSLSHPQNEGMAFLGQTLGARRAYGRSALGRRFEGSEGRGQHAFGVARPLVQLCLGLAP